MKNRILGNRIAARISETDVLKAQPVPRQGALSEGACLGFDGLFEILIKIGEVQVVFVHPANRGKAGRKRRLTLFENH